MIRSASRLFLRPQASRPIVRLAPSRRFLSSAPPAQKSRSWKNSALRWGLAGAGIYYYNTHDVFAEEPAYAPANPEVDESENLPTIEQIAEQRRQRLLEGGGTASEPIQVNPGIEAASETDAESGAVEGDEAGQAGAFNPETGEINWDCPCLGGMAHGPCGEEFKAAFSCFVFSTEEPKGVDCIDKFKGMQDCFRQYPEVYAAELEEDDDMSAEEVDTPTATSEPLATPHLADTEVPEMVSKSVEHVEKPSDVIPVPKTKVQEIGDSAP